MQAVPPAGTAFREVRRGVEESEGHYLVCGLFVDRQKHFPNQNQKTA
jgi:hypothetical protein